MNTVTRFVSFIYYSFQLWKLCETTHPFFVAI